MTTPKTMNNADEIHMTKALLMVQTGNGEDRELLHKHLSMAVMSRM